METLSTLSEIGSRANGDVYLGVVGPVRSGKSTFIKRFMEVAVIPYITQEEEKKRATDELPQSGDGKTIMTVEPKFIPANAVSLAVSENLSISVRMIDCVGYLIDQAQGYLEDGKMRMVKTPWFSETIPFDEAAKIGTKKVIQDHATIGICVVTDGSIGDFKREDYLDAEHAIMEELKQIQKPYVIVLNSKIPGDEKTIQLARQLEESCGVPVLPMNVMNMTEEEANKVLKEALYQFPISKIDVALPKWVAVLAEDHPIKQSISVMIESSMEQAIRVKDVSKITEILSQNEYLSSVTMQSVDTSTGIVTMVLEVKEELYNQVLEDLVGCKIEDRAELMRVLTDFVEAKKNYSLIASAFQMAEETGYGYSAPDLKAMAIQAPEKTKNGSRYGVKVKAKACTYHIVKVNLESSFEPSLGDKVQCDYFYDYIKKAYDEDPLKVLDCEIFGTKFGDIIRSGVQAKLSTLPEPIKQKLQVLLHTVVNKGKSNLIAFVF